MNNDFHGSEIAIIGMSGRFPKARTTKEFWKNIVEERECISFFSDAELEQAGIPAELLANPNYVKANGMLDDIDLFDAPLFGFTPREAQLLDPQQRIFLECAWEALENAGYDPEVTPESIGLYAGAGQSVYMFQNLIPNPTVTESIGFDQIVLGNGAEFLCTKVAYKLNLKGPTVSVLTACSTSLVAVHLACQALLGGECSVALAGGVSIPTLTAAGYMYSPGHILSPDGHCRAFDADAQGTITGGGVGIVVLKRLSDALNDRDHVEAVIKGSAINNDGAVKVGYTAPSIAGQAKVIAEALAMADVDAETIGLIEAHGTGTPLGDPIEMEALTRAFRIKTAKERFCAIGSVKTNVGHLDAAAGVAGLIKAVMALKNQTIPASLHLRKPNPKIDFEHSPFYVPVRSMAWKRGEAPLRAGVSSFGIGGTNAHVVVEEAPSMQNETASSRPLHLLTLSGRTLSALEQASARMLEFLRNSPDVSIADICYTLHLGRKPLPYRRVVVCGTLADAIEGLETLIPKTVTSELCAEGERPVVFLFPGQGTQYAGMTRQLYETEPVFRTHVDRCSSLLQNSLKLDLRKILYPEEQHLDEAAAALERTEITQPALFVVEYALAQLWMSWGLTPRAMVGHSVGEFVAACIAGVFSLEDALQLIATRGRLMQVTPPGAMLAVALPETEVRELVGSSLWLAAINAPKLTVVSGSSERIKALEHTLAQRQVNCRRLNTSRAFHSGLMEPALEAFRQAAQRVPMSAPKIPFVSNVSGGWASGEVANADYWVSQLREPVRFAQAVSLLLQLPNAIFLECGPGQTLSSLINAQAGARAEKPAFRSLPKAYDQSGECEFLMKQLGRLWLRGVRIAWPEFHAGERLRRIALPTYPFERIRYWIPPAARSSAAGSKNLARQPLKEWFYAQSWSRSALPARTEANAQPAPWLFFQDRLGLGAACAREMRSHGYRVIEIQNGDAFAKNGQDSYSMCFARAEDYQRLLANVKEDFGSPVRAAHFRNVTGPADQGISAAKERFFDLIFLAQALVNADTSAEVVIISDGLQCISGEEISAAKALLLGPCHTIPLEMPAIRCRSVDIEVRDGNRDALARLLCRELSGSLRDHVVAWRGAYRWIQQPRQLDLDVHFEQRSRLKENGVYWITGGLGGIGMEIAGHLVKSYNARLVITDLYEVPPPEEWESCVTQGALPARIGERLLRLREWMQAGAEILVAKADAADPAAMRSVAREALARYAVMDGIIHAAGMPGIGLAQFKKTDAAEKVFHPKIEGALVLRELCSEIKPEFLLLCSSLNAITSAFGQVDYSAANAFMDSLAVAAQSSTASNAVLSLNWDTWKSVGMAAEAEVPPELEIYKEQGLRHGIDPREGVKVFEAALRFSGPQLVISTRDLGNLQAAMEREPSIEQPAEQPAEAASLKPASARPELSSPYLAPSTELEKEIARIWEDVFGIDSVGLTDNFFELGGHSLLATQLISRLRKSLELEIPFQCLFDAPTVGGLAREITRMQSSTEAALLQQEPA